jgi:hypothetical protein
MRRAARRRQAATDCGGQRGGHKAIGAGATEPDPYIEEAYRLWDLKQRGK